MAPDLRAPGPLERGAGDEEVMILPHVSTDFGFTLRLASLLTREQADPFRLLDGLEGWL